MAAMPFNEFPQKGQHGAIMVASLSHFNSLIDWLTATQCVIHPVVQQCTELGGVAVLNRHANPNNSTSVPANFLNLCPNP